METRTFTLNLTFETDWHIGSGLEQPGGNDRLVRRDQFGLPFVPGKSITGMIRDAAETLAMGIAADSVSQRDGESSDAWLARLKLNIWYRWVLWMFGDQPTRAGDRLRHSSLHASNASFRPAFLPERLRRKIGATRPDGFGKPANPTHRAELRRALFFSKPGVKIGHNGRSEDKHLRQDEMVRRGLTLSAAGCSIRLPVEEPLAAFVCNFLQLAVAYVERIGAKRRRGAGKVAVQIESMTTLSAQDLAAYFQQLQSPPELPEFSDPLTVQADSDAVHAEGDQMWLRVPYQLTLKTPLLVSQRTIGNVVKSFDHVPGTMLLPLLSRTFGRAVGPEIVVGNLRAMPASPVIASGGELIRGIPIPTCFAHPKGEGAWFEASGDVSNRLTESIGDHVKTFRSGFVGITGDTLPTFGTTPIVVNPHNTIAEQQQRPTTEVGGVFSYEAIEAGTVLIGEFRVRQCVQESLQLDWEKLPDQVSLGRSRKDDYGLAELKVMQPESLPSYASTAAITADNSLTIWLTSDAILRDKNLRFSPVVDTLRDVIAKNLGLPASDLTVDRNHTYLRQRRIESWHVGWGLPRATIVAIAGGSCVRFKLCAGKTLPSGAVAKLQAEGIGERRAEGYGAVLGNHPLLDAQLATLPPAQNLSAKDRQETNAVKTQVDQQLARLLERRVWRDRIKRQALNVAVNGDDVGNHPLKFTSDKPGGAQAGLLRNLLRLPLDTRLHQSEVTERIKRLQQMRPDKWPAGALGKVQELLADSEAVWELLEADAWPTLTQNATRDLKAELWPEAIQVLVHTCLKVHQRQREKTRTVAAQPTKGAN